MRVATPGRVLKGHSARGDPAKFGQRTQADSVEGGAKPIRLAMLKTSLSSERCALHKGAPMEMVNFNCAAVLPGEICAHSKRKSYEKVYPPGPWELERVRVVHAEAFAHRSITNWHLIVSSAADLTFLHHLQQTLLGTSNRG